MLEPKISFLVSAYKAEKFIDRRLRNLLVHQTEKDIEVIVVDSASPENEKEVVEKWQSAFPEKVTYIRQPERTPYGVSWLEAYKVAKGEFCANANCDDLIYPDFTTRVYETFKTLDDRVAFLYTGLDTVSEDGRILGRGIKPQFNWEVFTRECWAGPCVTFRNDDKFKSKLYFEWMQSRAKFLTSAFDYWWWLYFMHLGYKGYSLPEVLIQYTARNDSIENSNKALNTFESLVSIAEFFPHHFFGHLKEFKEFRKFPYIPEKTSWVEARRRGKTWQEKKEKYELIKYDFTRPTTGS